MGEVSDLSEILIWRGLSVFMREIFIGVYAWNYRRLCVEITGVYACISLLSGQDSYVPCS